MKAKIFYFSLTDEMRKEEKLDWFRSNDFENIPFERIRPDEKGNWINLSESDFQDLIPVCNKEGKLGREGENTIFELYSLGINTSRDEWSYDFNKNNLEKKAKFFIEFFHKEKERWKKSNKTEKINNFVNRKIKWTTELEEHLVYFASLEEELSYLQSLPPNGKREKIQKMKKVLQKYLNFKYNRKNITISNYRPFVKQYFYFQKLYTHRPAHYSKILGLKNELKNIIICFTNTGNSKDFHTLVSQNMVDLHFTGDSQCLPFYRYSENGERKENITDWALELFRKTYKVSKNLIGLEREISKLDIFHYVYAVLHQPEYRKKYEIDLKRDFPRIPLYADFWKYADAGEKLMELHLNYENLTPPPPLQMEKGSELSSKNLNLQMERGSNTFSTSGEKKLPSPFGEGLGVRLNRLPLESLLPKRKKSETSEQEDAELLKKIKPDIKLKAKDGIIEIDELTTISNIPDEVWEYRLGNRSAVEWVLDQYKPYKSSDATIQEKFNNYDFFEYKEEVIKLLLQVIYVSVETMKIVKSL